MISQEWQRDLGRRTLALLDNKTTDMSERTMDEPLAGYRSPEQLQLEKQMIFGRLPLFVGLSCDLPEPGSWMTFDATGTPMLIVRGEDGRVRAFLNMCQHRGVRVAEEACGKDKRFVCPFHAWVYDLEGKLVGIPGSEGFNDMDWEQRGLIPLPAEEKWGMIFAAGNPSATFDLAEFFPGDLGRQLADLGLDKWHSAAKPHSHRIGTNWKVVWGTHCETYHFAQLHKKTARPFVYSNTSLADFYGKHALMTTTFRTIDKLRTMPEEEWRPVEDGMLSLNYRFFPNLSFSVVYGDRLEIFTIYPGNEQHETFSWHFAYVKDAPESPEAAQALEENVRFVCKTVVDAEDYMMAERAGVGLKGPFVPDTLVFGRNEPVMQHMALTLRQTLGQSV